MIERILIFFLASLFIASAAWGQQLAPPKERLNILMIVADDMNWDTPGCFGGAAPDVTPHLDDVLSAGKWPTRATQDYVENRNKDTIFIPMIESVRGVENLDKICSIPGVAAVFVGPNDMTVNMGIPNQYDHEDFIAILQRIIDTANARHVAAGCWFGNESQAIRTIRQGARLVVFSNDGLLFKNAISESFAKVKQG